MKTTYYNTCPHCGAALDPGEKCDCRAAKKEAKPSGAIIKPERRRNT